MISQKLRKVACLLKEASAEYTVQNATAFDKELEKFVRSLGAKKITNHHGTVGFDLPEDSDIEKVKDFLKKHDKDKNSYIQSGSSRAIILWDSKKASDIVQYE